MDQAGFRFASCSLGRLVLAPNKLKEQAPVMSTEDDKSLGGSDFLKRHCLVPHILDLTFEGGREGLCRNSPNQHFVSGSFVVYKMSWLRADIIVSGLQAQAGRAYYLFHIQFRKTLFAGPAARLQTLSKLKDAGLPDRATKQVSAGNYLSMSLVSWQMAKTSPKRSVGTSMIEYVCSCRYSPAAFTYPEVGVKSQS